MSAQFEVSSKKKCSSPGRSNDYCANLSSFQGRIAGKQFFDDGQSKGESFARACDGLCWILST